MNTKSTNFGLVIERYDKVNHIEYNSQMLLDFLEQCDYIEYFAFILHNQDFDEVGTPERAHYHLVITTSGKYAKETILNDFAKNFILNKNCISIRALVDKSKMVQYLVHKNEDYGLKHRYSCQDIITNDVDYTINTIINPICEERISIGDIIKLCNSSKDITEVYIRLGLKNSRIYRNVVKDVWDYCSGRPKGRKL